MYFIRHKSKGVTGIRQNVMTLLMDILPCKLFSECVQKFTFPYDIFEINYILFCPPHGYSCVTNNIKQFKPPRAPA